MSVLFTRSRLLALENKERENKGCINPVSLMKKSRESERERETKKGRGGGVAPSISYRDHDSSGEMLEFDLAVSLVDFLPSWSSSLHKRLHNILISQHDPLNYKKGKFSNFKDQEGGVISERERKRKKDLVSFVSEVECQTREPSSPAGGHPLLSLSVCPRETQVWLSSVHHRHLQTGGP